MLFEYSSSIFMLNTPFTASQLWRMSTVDTAVQADYLAVAPG